MLPIILMTGFSKELNRMKKEFPEYIYAVIKKPFSREDIFKYIDVI
jgi:hypothetical protein